MTTPPCTVVETLCPDCVPKNRTPSAIAGVSGLLPYAELWSTPRMADWLVKGLARSSHSRQMSELIRAVARAKAPPAAKLFQRFLNRPAPCEIKVALIDASRHVAIPGIQAKLTTWSRSRNLYLARGAKQALADAKTAR